MDTRRVLPELRDWVWPFLTDYQRDGLCLAVARGNYHLWWPCGAGKTLGAIIWALATPHATLIITRASARRQWASELRRFATVDPYVLLPKSNRRAGTETPTAYLERVAREGLRPVIIAGWTSLSTTWEDVDGKEQRGLNPELDDLLDTMGAFSIVWDESHQGKSHKRWRRLARQDGGYRYEKRTTTAAVAGFLAPRAVRRLALTATPMPDRTRDLWAQLDLVDPGLWGKYWDWAGKYCDAYEDMHGWDDKGSSNIEELRTELARCAHIVPTELVSTKLPPLRRTVTWLPKDALSAASKEARVGLKSAAKAAKGHKSGEAVERLLQSKLELSASRKTGHVVQTVVDCLSGGQKVLVFTGLRSNVERLRDAVQVGLEKALPKAKGGDWKLWGAHGGTLPEDRETIREDYMAYDGPACIVGTGAAWGESLNLQQSDRLIIVMLPWTWGQIRQWEGRVRRLGGKPCLVEYLVAEGTIDERVSSIVLDKLAAVENVLPDEQVADIRITLQGGTDDALIDGLLDRFME
jgi:SNF2 family DNA or RNA helicase